MEIFNWLFGDSSNKKKKISSENKMTIREKAENKLGLVFSEDYISFVKNYGAVQYKGELFLGLRNKNGIDTVKSTLEERMAWTDFPRNMYVISLLGIDGILILQDSNGNIYEYVPFNKPELIYDCLQSYLNSIKND